MPFIKGQIPWNKGLKTQSPEAKKEYQHNYGIEWRKNNKKKTREYSRRFRKNHKEEIYQRRADRRGKYTQDFWNLKEFIGCQLCGFNKFGKALEFHHLHDKEFEISAYMYRYHLRRVAKEMEKCVLLCANCHAEVEYYNE